MRTFNVLFICTGNSARSILAEGLMNHLGNGRFRAWSAGSHPKGEVHPAALSTLQALHIPAEGFSSKSWDGFARSGAPAHWGVPDPAARIDGETDAEQARRFRDVAHVLKRRIELLLALPVDKLEPLSLQSQLDAIGRQ